MTRHFARGAAALLLLVLTIASLSQAAHAGDAKSLRRENLRRAAACYGRPTLR